MKQDQLLQLYSQKKQKLYIVLLQQNSLKMQQT